MEKGAVVGSPFFVAQSVRLEVVRAHLIVIHSIVLHNWSVLICKIGQYTATNTDHLAPSTDQIYSGLT